MWVVALVGEMARHPRGKSLRLPKAKRFAGFSMLGVPQKLVGGL